MAATHHLKGVIAILEGIHKISNYKSENLTMKNSNGSKKTLDWNASWIYTFEHVLKICGTGMASSIDKEQQKQVHHSPQGGESPIGPFRHCPRSVPHPPHVYFPLKTSSIATWQVEPWVPEDLTSPPIWHTCTGGTGALSALGIVPGKCRLRRSGAKFTVLPLGLSISNKESFRTTKEICAYEINASHKNIVEDNFQLINW